VLNFSGDYGIHISDTLTLVGANVMEILCVNKCHTFSEAVLAQAKNDDELVKEHKISIISAF
jgi:hypothetical protein